MALAEIPALTNGRATSSPTGLTVWRSELSTFLAFGELLQRVDRPFQLLFGVKTAEKESES